MARRSSTASCGLDGRAAASLVGAAGGPTCPTTGLLGSGLRTTAAASSTATAGCLTGRCATCGVDASRSPASSSACAAMLGPPSGGTSSRSTAAVPGRGLARLASSSPVPPRRRPVTELRVWFATSSRSSFRRVFGVAGITSARCRLAIHPSLALSTAWRTVSINVG